MHDKVQASGAYTAEVAFSTWMEGVQTENYKFVATLTEFLKINKASSVAVLGAGGGYIPFYLMKHGIFTSCYDGCNITQDITYGKCGVIDLAKKINISKHDWVVSTHIGEHIDKKYEDIFLSNLDSTCKAGIILGWAEPVDLKIPDHVNEQYNSYIKAKMLNLGYYNAIEAEKVLKESGGPRLKDSIMVFVKKNYDKKIISVSWQNLKADLYQFNSLRDMALKMNHIDDCTEKEITNMPDKELKKYLRDKMITQYHLNKSKNGLGEIFELNKSLNLKEDIMILDFIYELRENSNNREVHKFLDEMAEELHGSRIDPIVFTNELYKMSSFFSNTVKEELKRRYNE